ncbi:MAG: hypothetical protein R3F43_32050 [bacterium]
MWVDWDTVLVRPPDEAFLGGLPARQHPEVHPHSRLLGDGELRCLLRFAPMAPRDGAESDAQVSEPNDELLWASVLPSDVQDREEFWWGDRAVQI